MAEKECGNVRTHHRERRTGTGQHGAFVNDNSCKKCGWLGDHIREYPLYNPRFLDQLSPADVARSQCAQFLAQGFDECLHKIPTVCVSMFEELPLRNRASLKTALNAARTAVVRYYLSTLTAAPHASSSFGGVLWRALESCDDSDRSRLSVSWRRFVRSWCNYHCRANCIPNHSPLASAAFFVAVYAPSMMPAFTREENAQECIAAIVDKAAYVPIPQIPPSAAQTATLHFKKNSGKYVPPPPALCLCNNLNMYCLSSLVLFLVQLEIRKGNDSVVKKKANEIGSFLKDKAIPCGIRIGGWLKDKAIPCVIRIGSWLKDKIITCGIRIDSWLEGIRQWFHNHPSAHSAYIWFLILKSLALQNYTGTLIEPLFFMFWLLCHSYFIVQHLADRLQPPS
jgi:hypothetical protein